MPVRSGASAADIEVLDSQLACHERYVQIDVHAWHSEEPPLRLVMVPVVRRRKPLFYDEMLGQAVLEERRRLDAAVGPIVIGPAVVEVHVAGDEFAMWRKEVGDLRELTALAVGEILEEPLGHDQIEWSLFGADRLLQNVAFDQVRRRFLYCDVYPVVLHVCIKEESESRGTATHVEQAPVLTGRQTIDETRHLEHSMMRSGVLRVLIGPEVSFVDGSRWLAHAVSIFLRVSSIVRSIDLCLRELVHRGDTTSSLERLRVHPLGSRCFDLRKGLTYLSQEIRHEEEDGVWRSDGEKNRVHDRNVGPGHAKAMFGG